MRTDDNALTRRIRDIVAVVVEDIDAVRFEVEEGVAYLEGVVASERDAHMILGAVSRLDGLKKVISCLSTERVFASRHEKITEVPRSPESPAPFYSQS